MANEFFTNNFFSKSYINIQKLDVDTELRIESGLAATRNFASKRLAKLSAQVGACDVIPISHFAVPGLVDSNPNFFFIFLTREKENELFFEIYTIDFSKITPKDEHGQQNPLDFKLKAFAPHMKLFFRITTQMPPKETPALPEIINDEEKVKHRVNDEKSEKFSDFCKLLQENVVISNVLVDPRSKRFYLIFKNTRQKLDVTLNDEKSKNKDIFAQYLPSIVIFDPFIKSEDGKKGFDINSDNILQIVKLSSKIQGLDSKLFQRVVEDKFSFEKTSIASTLLPTPKKDYIFFLIKVQSSYANLTSFWLEVDVADFSFDFFESETSEKDEVKCFSNPFLVPYMNKIYVMGGCRERRKSQMRFSDSISVFKRTVSGFTWKNIDLETFFKSGTDTNTSSYGTNETLNSVEKLGKSLRKPVHVGRGLYLLFFEKNSCTPLLFKDGKFCVVPIGFQKSFCFFEKETVLLKLFFPEFESNEQFSSVMRQNESETWRDKAPLLHERLTNFMKFSVLSDVRANQNCVYYGAGLKKPELFDPQTLAVFDTLDINKPILKRGDSKYFTLTKGLIFSPMFYDDYNCQTNVDFIYEFDIIGGVAWRMDLKMLTFLDFEMNKPIFVNDINKNLRALVATKQKSKKTAKTFDFEYVLKDGSKLFLNLIILYGRLRHLLEKVIPDHYFGLKKEILDQKNDEFLFMKEIITKFFNFLEHMLNWSTLSLKLLILFIYSGEFTPKSKIFATSNGTAINDKFESLIQIFKFATQYEWRDLKITMAQFIEEQRFSIASNTRIPTEKIYKFRAECMQELAKETVNKPMTLVHNSTLQRTVITLQRIFRRPTVEKSKLSARSYYDVRVNHKILYNFQFLPKVTEKIENFMGKFLLERESNSISSQTVDEMIQIACLMVLGGKVEVMRKFLDLSYKIERDSFMNLMFLNEFDEISSLVRKNDVKTKITDQPPAVLDVLFADVDEEEENEKKQKEYNAEVDLWENEKRGDVEWLNNSSSESTILKELDEKTIARAENLKEDKRRKALIKNEREKAFEELEKKLDISFEGHDTTFMSGTNPLSVHIGSFFADFVNNKFGADVIIKLINYVKKPAKNDETPFGDEKEREEEEKIEKVEETFFAHSVFLLSCNSGYLIDQFKIQKDDIQSPMQTPDQIPSNYEGNEEEMQFPSQEHIFQQMKDQEDEEIDDFVENTQLDQDRIEEEDKNEEEEEEDSGIYSKIGSESKRKIATFKLSSELLGFTIEKNAMLAILHYIYTRTVPLFALIQNFTQFLSLLRLCSLFGFKMLKFELEHMLIQWMNQFKDKNVEISEFDDVQNGKEKDFLKKLFLDPKAYKILLKMEENADFLVLFHSTIAFLSRIKRNNPEVFEFFKQKWDEDGEDDVFTDVLNYFLMDNEGYFESLEESQNM